MDISKLNKKELKDYINKNGFFFHMQCETLKKKAINDLLSDKKIDMIKTGVELPKDENIIVYRGIASQNYWKGQKSRNWYKYKQDGWDFQDYFINPLVLFQHDTAQPIWHALSFWHDEAGNLNIMFYVYKEALEWADKVRVEKGLITAISTGAYTDEYKFEEVETGQLLTEEEAEEKYGWSNLIDAFWGVCDFLILTITKARMIENSLVTIWSNEQAMAVQNGIWQYFQNKVEELKEKNKGKEEEENQEEKKNDVEEVDEEIKQEKKEEEQFNEEEKGEEEIAEWEEQEVEETQVEEETKEEEDLKENEKEEDIVDDIEDEKEEEETEETEETEEEAPKTEEGEDTEIESPKEDDKDDNQDTEAKEDAWNKAIDKFMSDFETKITTKMDESIKNSLVEVLKDYISVEMHENALNDLKKNLTETLDTVKDELKKEIWDLSKQNETIWETVVTIVDRLKKTIWNSAGSYNKVEEKPKSILAEKLELAKKS